MFQWISQLMIPLARGQAAAQQAGAVTSETAGEIERLIRFFIGQIPVWITGGLVIILSFVLANIVQRNVENKMAESGFEEENREIQVVVGRVVNVAVIIIGVTVGLKIAGIDLTTIIAAGAFGIGFALQDLIMNFLAGVMILSARHYKIGDIIKVNGIMGKITDIQTRATIVRNFDGTKVVLPNAELFKNPVTSYTSNPYRRVSIITGVEYGSDLKKAMEACLKAASECYNGVADPKPSVVITGFDESSINLKTNVWVESRKGILKTRTDLIRRVKKELDAVGENIPFPIRTIVFDEDAKKAQEEERKKREKQQIEEEKKLDALNEVPKEEAPAWLQNAAQQGVALAPAPNLQPQTVQQPSAAGAAAEKPIPGIRQGEQPQAQAAEPEQPAITPDSAAPQNPPQA